MGIEALPEDIRLILIAIFKVPPPRNVRWSGILHLFNALGIEYRLIDARVNVLVMSGAQTIRYTLHHKPGSGCLDVSDVDDVRHLLLMCGFDPRE